MSGKTYNKLFRAGSRETPGPTVGRSSHPSSRPPLCHIAVSGAVERGAAESQDSGSLLDRVACCEKSERLQSVVFPRQARLRQCTLDFACVTFGECFLVFPRRSAHLCALPQA